MIFHKLKQLKKEIKALIILIHLKQVKKMDLKKRKTIFKNRKPNCLNKKGINIVLSKGHLLTLILIDSEGMKKMKEAIHIQLLKLNL